LPKKNLVSGIFLSGKSIEHQSLRVTLEMIVESEPHQVRGETVIRCS
jgi:hypothetical protein